MAEINQYSLSLRELAELIIKATGVHEGEWSLTVGLQVGVGNYGPTPDQTFPGAAVSVHQIGIQRQPSGTPTPGPGSLVVDAAKVNPPPTAPKAASRKKK